MLRTLELCVGQHVGHGLIVSARTKGAVHFRETLAWRGNLVQLGWPTQPVPA